MVALNTPIEKSKVMPAVRIAVVMAVVVGTAHGFEHIGGYIPCALCLEQRTPYYLGVPVMILAAICAAMKAPAVLTRLLFVLGGGLMIYGAGLGAYHSGVEWGWWEGPVGCGGGTGGLTSDASSLLDDLNAKKPPACNEAALRVMGLSFAGWNVVASVLLAFSCLRSAFKA